MFVLFAWCDNSWTRHYFYLFLRFPAKYEINWSFLEFRTRYNKKESKPNFICYVPFNALWQVHVRFSLRKCLLQSQDIKCATILYSCTQYSGNWSRVAWLYIQSNTWSRPINPSRRLYAFKYSNANFKDFSIHAAARLRGVGIIVNYWICITNVMY
jgi:hypothetical protein